MKLIVLAAGEGKRLRPLTENKPKCMVPFRGKPLVQWIVDAARSCGVNDIVAVTGYRADGLIVDGVRRCHNPRYAATNMVATLFCAAGELAGDVIISYSDIIYTPEVFAALMNAPGEFCVVIDKEWEKLWRLRMDNPLDDAESLVLDERGCIVEIGKKTRDYAKIQGQYIGLIKIAATAIERVKAFYGSLEENVLYDGKSFENMYMTSFIQEIVARLLPVTAVPIRGGWLEIDSLADLDAYERGGFYPGAPFTG